QQQWNARRKRLNVRAPSSAVKMGTLGSKYRIAQDFDYEASGLGKVRRLSWLPEDGVPEEDNCYLTYDAELFGKGKIIGRGGFGEVRANRDPRTGMYYAVKTVPKRRRGCAEQV
ncbi:unnamed protein product, partial [Heterosigma akashiwo]